MEKTHNEQEVIDDIIEELAKKKRYSYTQNEKSYVKR